jgi:hypothetical protein
MDLVTLIAAAAEHGGEAAHEEHSETLFLVMGSILAVLAVVVATLGIRNPELPESATRGITLLGIVLVVLAAG